MVGVMSSVFLMALVIGVAVYYNVYKQNDDGESGDV
jgi:hypothetical protein